TSPPYAQTGWALLAPQPPPQPPPPTPGGVGGGGAGGAQPSGPCPPPVPAPPAGPDRLALASGLRAEQAQAIIVSSSEALVSGLREGRFEAGVTERLLADQIAADRKSTRLNSSH